MPQLNQPSFAAGELSPQTLGRIDLAKYRVGCKTLRNMLVLPQGGAWNRAGTAFVATIANSGYRGRLIPFQFSATQQFALEFGQMTMRVVLNGGMVLAPGGGSIYQLATPYAAVDLPLLKFTQSADTMFITHPSYAEMQLTRTADNAWTIAPSAYGATITPPTGLHGAAHGTISSDGIGGYFYQVTTISETGEESLPTATLEVDNSPLGGATTNTIGWDAVAGALYYNVYKVLASAVGYIGTTTGLSFSDNDIEPDAAIGVQQPRVAVGGQNQGVIEFHQQRLVRGGSTAKPETLYLSQSGNPLNFNTAVPTVDSDAITVTLATRQVNEIRNLVSLNSALLVMTSGAEFLCAGNADGVLTPSADTMRPQSYNGCSHAPALLVGSDVIYEMGRGSCILNIRYDFNSNQLQSVELSLYSSHLIVGFAVAEWCWSHQPDRVVWIVRNDGALLSMTYMRDQDIFAWARHDSPGGIFESVCSITELNVDVVYFIVNRDGTRCIERMGPRIMGETPGALMFLDSSLSYTGSATNSLSGFVNLEGATVTAITSAGLFPGLVVSPGGTVALPAYVTTAYVGVAYESDLETVNLETPYFDSAQGHMKKIPRLTVRFNNTTIAGVQMGVDVSNLESVAATNEDDLPIGTTVFTGDLKVNLDSDWGRSSSVFIRQTAPSPMTILLVMPEVELGNATQQAPPPIPPLALAAPPLPEPPKIAVPPDLPPLIGPIPAMRAPPKLDVADAPLVAAEPPVRAPPKLDVADAPLVAAEPPVRAPPKLDVADAPLVAAPPAMRAPPKIEVPPALAREDQPRPMPRPKIPAASVAALGSMFKPKGRR